MDAAGIAAVLERCDSWWEPERAQATRIVGRGLHYSASDNARNPQENLSLPLRVARSHPVRSTDPAGRTTMIPGPAVDAAFTLPDGTRLKDVGDLKRYVLEHPEHFGRALTEKLFTYGSGRVPAYAERRQLDATSDGVLADGGGFRDLLLAIVESAPFTR